MCMCIESGAKQCSSLFLLGGVFWDFSSWVAESLGGVLGGLCSNRIVGYGGEGERTAAGRRRKRQRQREHAG
jgi:hypothetical protein